MCVEEVMVSRDGSFSQRLNILLTLGSPALCYVCQLAVNFIKQT